MPDSHVLELIVRTPHDVVLQTSVRSLRVLTETGQVGLRPRVEAMVLALEAGIVNVRPAEATSSAEQFIGTAGGLLLCDGQRATLLTPLAVVGHTESEITEELDRIMQQPNSEMEARATLSKLEGRILTELRRQQQQDVRQGLREIG